MTFEIFLQMFPIALMFSAPIILTALGGLFSERSGIVNIALEGIMMVGAFTGATITVLLENSTPAAAWIGLLGGLLAGIVFSLLHAVASINLKADQVISGTALNILAGGLTVYLCQIIFHQQRTRAFSYGIKKLSVPGLSKIPVLGRMFFDQVYPTFYIAIAMVLLTWFVVYKTPLGLRMRACGEHPQAAASMGINVSKMRYFGVLVSGALGGLGGAVMVLTADIQYTLVSIHGTGFISLASLVFGRWNPFGVLGAGFFFGFSTALSFYAKDIPLLSGLPGEFFYILPYLLTIIALLFFAGKSVGPKAAGQIYESGER
ncbi:MAG TPA: ABC transporter permease [Rectinema sp.]|jgi:simple sugar transport system permease protein|nr:ABC transporter permease [Rectinema sp.]HOM92227.1 ABC transporter permease [Rectinema sp.]HOR48208.1 ABC transporter permease [Rectinema sp.]HOU06816.1 ABC transporter permease [Rectinema sp.]HOW11702.1 ABC transporter permease [Rectinema sp.]